MAYTSTDGLFRSLTDDEEAAFRAYAQNTAPEISKWTLYHPVCRAEWTQRGYGPGMDQDMMKEVVT